MDTECVFEGILRHPLDISQLIPNSSFNNLTVEMRQSLAQSIGIKSVVILPVRETKRIPPNYYASLEIQLINYFGKNVSKYSVQPDGNCLYRALSQIIFGMEDYYELLKHQLI